VGVDFVASRRGLGQGQTPDKFDKYYGEAYGFFGRRNSTPGTNVGGTGYSYCLAREFPVVLCLEFAQNHFH
jgi:hypothetical protein